MGTGSQHTAGRSRGLAFTCNSDRNKCSKGEYRERCGACGIAVKATCCKCKKGYYSVRGDYNTYPEDNTCLPCYWYPKESGATTIDNTPWKSYYGDVAGSSSCKKCADNEYAADSNANTYYPSGGWQPLIPSSAGAETTCKTCTAPKIVGYRSTFVTACYIPCAPGTFYSQNGNRDPTPAACKTCPAGQFSSNLDSTSCSQCAAGKISQAGAASCSQCAAGNSSQAGAASCSQCAAGKSAQAGASCSQCAAGKISQAGAASWCVISPSCISHLS